MLASTTTRHLKTFFDELDESSKLVFPSLFLPLEARVVIGFRRAAEEGAICLRETFFLQPLPPLPSFTTTIELLRNV